MTPKKAKIFIPAVAEKIGVSEEIVTDLIRFFWTAVRKDLSTLSSPRVHVSNLGDFVVKHWNIDDRIMMYKRWEENNKEKGIQKMKSRWQVAEKIFELENLKVIIAEEQQRKEFIQLHKKTYELKEKHIPYMEKQGEHIRRDKE